MSRLSFSYQQSNINIDTSPAQPSKLSSFGAKKLQEEERNGDT